MNNGKLFIGMALGMLAGSALACFAHSRKGCLMRRQMYGVLEELRERACQCKDCDCGDDCECKEGKECECKAEEKK